MKIDRMLETVILLLKHESLSARQLAKRFGVSVRTIQRDMESLSVAGIPITTGTGAKGGYSILSSYKLANQFVTRSDFRLLIMALRGLKSSYDNKRVNTILDRYLAMAQDSGAISVDYSVTQEGQDVQKSLQVLESAIENHMQVQFSYQNVHGVASHRVVNPLQLKFKWYAWYLFATDASHGEMRTFKVARMREVQKTTQPSSHLLMRMPWWKHKRLPTWRSANGSPYPAAQKTCHWCKSISQTRRMSRTAWAATSSASMSLYPNRCGGP